MDIHVKTLEGLKNNQIRMTINKTVKNNGPKIIKTIPLNPQSSVRNQNGFPFPKMPAMINKEI